METEKAQGLKRFDKVEKNITFAGSIAKIGFQVGIFIGILVTLFYCGTIGYYPSNLTLGDSFFLLASSLAFALVHSIFVFIFFCAGIIISPIYRGIQSGIFVILGFAKMLGGTTKIRRITFPELGSRHLVEITVGFIAICIIIIVTVFDSKKGLSILFSAALYGIIYGLWNTKPIVRSGNFEIVWQLKTFLIVIAYLIPIFFSQLGGDFTKTAMNLIGVRSEGNTVLVAKKHVRLLDHHGIKPARKNSGADIYENVQILFQGIGDKSVLKFGDFKMIVFSEDITIGKQVDF